jgi:hypothetical protein
MLSSLCVVLLFLYIASKITCRKKERGTARRTKDVHKHKKNAKKNHYQQTKVRERRNKEAGNIQKR